MNHYSIDFRISNGTKISLMLDPFTFILSPASGGEGEGEGDLISCIVAPLLLRSSIRWIGGLLGQWIIVYGMSNY